MAEVEIAVPGGRQIGQGPGEKKIDRKLWNLQFLIYTNDIDLKIKLRTIVIYIWNKIRDFLYWKNWKKVDSMIFDPKKL